MPAGGRRKASLLIHWIKKGNNGFEAWQRNTKGKDKKKVKMEKLNRNIIILGEKDVGKKALIERY